MREKKTVELDRVEYDNLLNRIKFFQNIVREISERKPLQNLLDEIIKSSKKLLNSQAASLLLFDEENSLLVFHTIAGGTSYSMKKKALKLGEGIGGWVAENKRPLIINDCYQDPRFNKEFDTLTGYKTKNMLCVPMINNDKLIGVIQVINKNEDLRYNQEDLDLFEVLAAQCAVAIENSHSIDLEIKTEQAKHELETAWQIQKRFLPENIPSIDGVDISIKLKPAKEIGGDFFTVLQLDNDNFLFFVADVSGKSVSAALIVSTLYSFINFYFVIKNDNNDPIEFVQAFNRFLIKSTTQDKFVTAWLGFYNKSTKKLSSINAGHNPTYLIKNNEHIINYLTKGGIILGSMDLLFDSEQIKLNRGDMIVFYTDGVIEALNPDGQEFGTKKFEELLIDNKNLTASELTKRILNSIAEHQAESEQSDDITLGIIKF